MKQTAFDTALSVAQKKIDRLKPDQFELYLSHNRKVHIEAKDGKVDSLTQAEDVGLSVRVIHKKRPGFSFTTSLEAEAVEKAVQSAFEISENMPEDPLAGLELFRPETFPKMEAIDRGGLEVPTSEKVKLALELEANTRRADPRIQGIRSASFAENSGTVCLVDSQGTRIQHEEALFTASVTCRADQNGDSQMGGDFDFSPKLASLNLGQVATRAAKSATELLGAKSAPTLKCPAILRNDVVAELIEFLSSSFSAEQIDKGRSLLAGKENQALFSPLVTLVDDGLLPGGYGSGPFDAEGSACRKTTLVEKGVFKSALYDVYYGRKFKKPASGCSLRGIKSPPRIGFTNLAVENGNTSLESLIGGIPRGILLTSLMGVHTANPVTGDFSLGASGLFIESGRVTHPVKGFAVAGNLLELFKRITDIGNDRRFFGNVGTPSVLVSEISVGGS